MDKIDEKLLEIEELIKNIGGMQIAMPKVPKPATLPTAVKAPSTAPTSQKDPLKVAQQISDPSTKKAAVKQAKSILKIENNGQWKLEDK